MKIILGFILFCTNAYSLHMVKNEKIIFIGDDCSYEILSHLDKKTWQACRLVCWKWRARIDWLAKNYFKIKIPKAPIDFYHDNDFARMRLMQLGQKAFQRKYYKQTFDNFSKAAAIKPGNAQATYMVGCLFLRGLGTQKSVREGLYQLEKAADNGYDRALFDMALFFLWGCADVDDGSSEKEQSQYKDPKLAIELFTKLLPKQHPGAIYQMGKIYAEGDLVERNMDKAIELFRESASYNYKEAIEALKIVEDE